MSVLPLAWLYTPRVELTIIRHRGEPIVRILPHLVRDVQSLIPRVGRHLLQRFIQRESADNIVETSCGGTVQSEREKTLGVGCEGGGRGSARARRRAGVVWGTRRGHVLVQPSLSQKEDQFCGFREGKRSFGSWAAACETHSAANKVAEPAERSG